jgi:Arthropod defensin
MMDRMRIIKAMRLLVVLFTLGGAFLSSPVSALYQCTLQEQRACQFHCGDLGASGGTCSSGVCYCY